MTEIKCPKCGTVSESWQVFEMTGEGEISFTEREEPKVKEFIPSHVSTSCPKCGYAVEGNIYAVRDKLLTA